MTLVKKAKLGLGIWAAIAAGGVLFILVCLPVLGWMFSRSKKDKKAEVESAAEKGEVIVEAAPARTRPANAMFQKPVVTVSQHQTGEVRTQSSTTSMTPSYQSQASTASSLRNSTPYPPYMQPLWTQPKINESLEEGRGNVSLEQPDLFGITDFTEK